MPQSTSLVDGRSVPLAEAQRAAAALLAASRLPLFLVGACDVAGTRAVIRLAERAGGVVDHAESAGAFRELDVMRSFGKFIVTPNEARQRADTVLLVGAGLTKLWPDMDERLGLGALPRLALRAEPRQILWIGAEGEEQPLSELAAQRIESPAEALPGLIGALRACNGRRPLALPASAKTAVGAVAEGLRHAQFGLIVYSPSSLDALGIEMLMGLVADLNKITRFSTLSVSRSGNAETVLQTAGWMTGFPVRTGFGRGHPEHDPWRFDATRLVERGEADLLFWIAGDSVELPSWASGIPTVALSPADVAPSAAKVQIGVGRYGRDHDAVDFARETQSLVWQRASEPNDLPSAAMILDEIATSLAGEGP